MREVDDTHPPERLKLSASGARISNLAAERGVRPLENARELADPDVWTSDGEVELFNATVRSERDRDRDR